MRVDYFKYAGSGMTLLLAVGVNVAAQWPPISAFGKFIYLVVSTVLMVVAFLFQFFSEKVLTESRRKVREALGSFIERAQNVQSQTIPTSRPLPQEEFKELSRDLIQYLERNLGHSYVVRLSDGMGIPPTSSPSGSHGDIWLALRVWIIRLQEFSQELPS